MNKTLSSRGFTIVELIIVIAVVGVLATIVTVAYSGIQAKARDTSILSDLDTLDALETKYAIANSVGLFIAKAWYSGAGIDADLQFVPSTGNVIDVVVGTGPVIGGGNGTARGDYCIRGYNISSNYKSISTAATKESSTSVCAALAASAAAVSASP